MTLLAAASPGDPEDPLSWAGYTELTSHVLATAPLGDHSPAGRQLVLDTARYLHAHGDSDSSRAVGKRCSSAGGRSSAPTIRTP